MNEKLISATEGLMRRIYKLGESYVSSAFSVKPTTIEMTMKNGLIELKAKFPRTLVEDNIDYAVEDEDEDEE